MLGLMLSQSLVISTLGGSQNWSERADSRCCVIESRKRLLRALCSGWSAGTRLNREERVEWRGGCLGEMAAGRDCRRDGGSEQEGWRGEAGAEAGGAGRAGRGGFGDRGRTGSSVNIRKA